MGCVGLRESAPRFPRAESLLKAECFEKRRKGKKLSSRWLMIRSRQLMKQEYPSAAFQGWQKLCTASSQKIRHGAAEGHQLPGSHHNGEAFRVPAVPQRASQHRLQTIGLHACREDGPSVGSLQNLESHFRRHCATRVHHGALQHYMGTQGQQESFSQVCRLPS